MGTDTTTSGDWIGVYGQDGNDICPGTDDAVAPDLPSYATVSLSDSAIPLSWDLSDPVPPIFAENPDGTGRVDTTWYSTTSFDINVDLTDGQVHQVTVYAVDWTGNSRNERFDIIDPVTGVVLDSESISTFGSGVYLTWNISGAVTIRVTNTGVPTRWSRGCS